MEYTGINILYFLYSNLELTIILGNTVISLAKVLQTIRGHTHPHFWVLEPLKVPLKLKQDKITSEPLCVE
jgi:hypothetical protein